ncbi:hypothetical protein L914_18514 [Phytophthora nicotianae]|uniref:G-patch domain-containing protein n=1 Tax=Phytophthora nicotianae TaxID=4792 RepID=W2MFH3_PHYNI|nr:hypothetical protein L914_18514 [Phytophthora nicotianae]
MKRGSIRNQEVTDAQGRRRFHGAFTGGFSAGYYNSVGSEEGWTPKTFSSSRSSRSSRVEQRPEDFMDEEDDPLLGKRLETTERYDTLQTGAKRQLQQQPDRTEASIPGFSLPEDWVLPVNDSIGAKLLKQMGWKEGHGIGQRVRRRKYQDEKDTEQPKLLTQDAREDKTKTEPQDEEEVYVPPRKVFDVQKAFPKPKLDRYGAGFDPYSDAPEFSMYKQQQERKQKEGSHRQVVSFLDALKSTDGSNRATTGYGLSALEENDDIDVYGTVSMAEFDRVIAPLGTRKDVKRLDSSAQESRRYEKLGHSRALCSDGRPVLPGFELAASKEKPPKAVNVHLTVPSDFKAYHRFEDDEDQSDTVTALYRKYNFSTDNMGNRMVTARQRAALLEDDKKDTHGATAGAGEVKSSTRSVFDLLGDEQKAKLFDAAAQAKQGVPLSSAKRATTDVSAAPRVRQPLVSGSTGDQFRATISASIAKRFVSSKSTVDEEISDSVSVEEPQTKKSRRSQSLWIPKSLLCKRFHVKCAGPTGSSGKDDEHDKKRDLFDKELVPHLMDFAADRAANRQSEINAFEGSKFAKAVESNPGEDRGLPPLPAVEKASTDLLKSIFEPSDESEVSEDESEDESDDEGNDEERNKAQGEAKQHENLSRSPLKTSLLVRDAANAKLGRCQLSSEESNSSDEDDANPSAGASGSGNDEDMRGRKRSPSVDDVSGRDAKRRKKEEKKKRKKHKKHHKHRSSRDDKEKRKKYKKDRKERRSDKHHSSRHSRRSRSAEHDSRRDRSSSRRR